MTTAADVTLVAELEARRRVRILLRKRSEAYHAVCQATGGHQAYGCDTTWDECPTGPCDEDREALEARWSEA